MFKKRINKLMDKLKMDEQYSEQSSLKDINLKEQIIDSSLEKNIETFQFLYSIPTNTDVKIRQIKMSGFPKKVAILYISSIIDTKIIEDNVIKALQQNNDPSARIENIISAESVNILQKIEDILKEINKGSAALFVEGEAEAYLIGAANFQGRSIEKPENEVSLKGPKEAFNEKAMTNISLIRKKIKNENLVVESTTISKRSKNELYIVYIKDLVNNELLQNVKDKVNSFDIDAIQNLSILEELIDERPRSLFPTILYTERPDRATHYIEDSFIVLLMENSPGALILPATFWSFYHSSDDRYLRFLYGNFTRFIRILALFITLFTSAIYVAITNFHAEMVPADLLLAISANREKVPFPSFIEVLMMETAFELIREAGLRVPNPIGPTIGIVGALILGQAAVQANIVSPIVVIVVALGGLSSFAVGDISMNFAIRLSRFFIIFSAGVFGIYGMTAIFTLALFYFVSLKSFGVPYLAPMTPKYISSQDTIFRKIIKNERFRPGYLKPKDIEKKAGDTK
ncbi:spore germination protein [Neobacillus sp. D3-1R]|uniref:spore germination protein n=1 Tax=Neobacillus sp. D3-1R TaxID=3445778 RepID=UPI003F9F9AF2